MGLYRTISDEINGDFSRKSLVFPTHRVFNVPFELGIGAKGQKLE